MTSQGDDEKINRAKSILSGAIIGLIIILSAFGIASFVLNSMLGSTIGTNSGDSSNGGNTGSGRGIGAAGNLIIETHYPARNQENIPRNTKVMITFKEPINPTTIIAGGNINFENVKIFATEDTIDNALEGSRVVASNSADNKTFILDTVERFDKDKWYTVKFTDGVKKVNGDKAFSTSSGYEWNFKVGDNEDSVPPQIESVMPAPNSTEPRNTTIQINFNEPIDPTTILGDKKFIIVSDGTNQIAGNFYISNNYETVEFLTDEKCGTNSCGEDVFCLPGGRKLQVKILAANLAKQGEPAANFPYDGITDLAGNSLDGNKNLSAQGPISDYDANNPDATGGDNYLWSFNTNNRVVTDPPKIISIKPDKGPGASLSEPIQAEFDHAISGKSLVKDATVKLSPNTGFYYIGMTNNSGKSTVLIRHEELDADKSYSPEFTSGIKDIYQNCFTPCSSNECAGSPSCCNGATSNDGECK